MNIRLMSVLLAFACLAGCTAPPEAVTLRGTVIDTNGQPLAQVAVIYTRPSGAAGPAVVTVFSDEAGRFQFPDRFTAAPDTDPDLTTRSLRYRLVQTRPTAAASADAGNAMDVTLVLAPSAEQSHAAPASAWLNRIAPRAEKSAFVMNCIDCHQVPASEQRAYAAAILDQHPANAGIAQTESWRSMALYMNYLSRWEFSRGARADDQKLDAESVYAVDDSESVVRTMTTWLADRLDSMSGYQWGAPLLANARTTIYEYQIDHPNAVREALLLGSPQQLWVADVAANRMVSVDVASGVQTSHEVPSDQLMSPHSLHRDADGNLWVTPLFNSIIAYRDLAAGTWKTWKLRTPDGKNPGIHDLSFGHDHNLKTDAEGRIWFSDIGNNAVGYFHPDDGASRVWTAPPSPGRPGPTALYGLSMTKDGNEVWYSQLANGTFGGFDIAKQQFIGPFQFPDPNAGPRRISISDEDVIYMALYGSGQLAEFDTKTRSMIAVHDLPDTGSAPYTTTWDDVRKVVWIGTANGDVIYRFDPRTRQFGVLPLPRERAFLRMIDVDPKTGVLITSYANIVDVVQGPRMALIIDPGDDVYPEKFVVPASQQAGEAPAPVPAVAGAGTGQQLFEEKRCYICHETDRMSLGPPLQAIATRHGAQRETMIEPLARKIVHGGGGNWGVVPMVPNQWVSMEEARVMAEWILSGAPTL